MDVVSFLSPLLEANDHRPVAIGIARETSHLDHDVQQGHVRAVWYGARLDGFADDADLPGDRPDELHRRNRYQRFLYERLEFLLDLLREIRGSLARRDNIPQQRHGDAAVRTHRYAAAQIRLVPNDNIKVVARS